MVEDQKLSMNHPNPYFNPYSFTFLPQNPNPNPISNPNPDFAYVLPQPPQAILPETSISVFSSNSDLQTTISILKNFIDLAQTNLKSVSDLLYSGKPTVSDHDFSTCPFDSRHRMPPEFLFRHYLQCPSSPGVIDLGLLEPLRYPNSLKSEEELWRENRFVRPLQDADSDLFFSLDEYEDVGSNFYYRDCPGVVSSSEQDASKKTFILPCVLSIECANFISKGDKKIGDMGRGDLRILPSELWALRSEVDLWSDIPSSYSYTVCRVAMCLQMIREADILKWVISNSPFYGVVIDVSIRDHIFLLLKLCLKAISRDAFHSSELVSSTDSSQGNWDLNPKSFSFKCSVLVEVMMWLSSQLSVLYGEANGKLFSVNMLKHCLLNAASRSLLFPLTPKQTVAIGSGEGSRTLDASVSDMGGQIFDPEVTVDVKDKESSRDDNATTGLVFISQVAAAIAALHERSLLEEKIKGLRFAGSLPKYQLIAEHSYLSMRANEERRKRPNYCPILEHDGLYWKHSENQDLGKNKTMEERLAEERDYKRRSVSYRGKKAKRSKTQVMRDIIEEHMETIKQAGGIGCLVSACNMAADVNELKKSAFGSTEPSRGQSHSYKKQIISDNEITYKCSGDAPPNDQLNLNNGSKSSHQRQRCESLGHHEAPEDHRRPIGRESRDSRHDKEYSSRSPESYRSHSRSHEHRSHQRHRHQRERDDENVARSKYDESGRSSSHRSRHHDNTPFDSHDRKNSKLSDINDRSRGRRHKSNLSESMVRDTIEDRYDPSGFYDRYDPI
ncbi:U11/U12 small nuclear ribonucleoprotein 48 kDa protein isoform X2 [Telopea speciosissima]|uniref:U11/U12 small nuclear ribonucleoprotein 48 kDa protein isoform X2 n=1 Tax=Telopea speciosissima TaxID=54955 RepID=UPI001CC57722|nr:U11/U12 small nuclear ribonucleoprotein 48 kDa protein isoform X2 [Telopea speciosissima]